MGFFKSDAPARSTSELVAQEFAKERKSFYRPKRHKVRKNELDLSGGIALKTDFPDPEGLLETAYADLEKSWNNHLLPAGGSIPFMIRKDSSYAYEEASLVIGEDSIVLTGGDTEGIRRGIYAFCRLLESSEGPFLKKELHHIQYAIRNRISRSYYGPIHRPPNNIDELLSDIDYYPAPYLSTLAAEGINVLWLTVVLSEVSYSSIQEKDPRMEERLERLRKTVERCRRYGIRIFVFYIEPVGFVGESDLMKAHPELIGVDWGFNMKCFCPSSKTAYDHLYEQMYHLFKSVPHLGGAINIPAGEALCSCFFGGNNTMTGFSPYKCPRCHDLAPYQVLNNSLEPLYRGMKDAAPEADYVCWLYQAAAVPDAHEWIHDCVRHLPEGMIFLYNMESGIQAKQQGHIHCGGDYWQSMPGCSDRFAALSETALKSGTRMGAKMQISNDHAIATVPVIPVPETLYKKYRILHKYSVDTVMYSWYFGCFPGLMNRAALELSQINIPSTAEEFLQSLALKEFGKADSERIARSWKYFSRAFACYPLSNIFQYKGPVNAGLSWTLYPEAKVMNLTDAWQGYADSGDCIGQCLRNYTLEDAFAQTSKMSRLWRKGMECIRPLMKKYPEGSEQSIQFLRAEAIDITFRNAVLILRFYLKRREFYAGNRKALRVMEKMVADSITLTSEMKALCKKDLFLGYHSEAESHKFSFDQLAKREKDLKKLLKEVFPRMRKKSYVPSLPEGCFTRSCKGGSAEIVKMKTFSFCVKKAGSDLEVTVRIPDSVVSENAISERLEIQLCDKLGTSYPIQRAFDREGCKFNSAAFTSLEMFKEKDSWGAVAKIPLGELVSYKEIAFDVRFQRMEKGVLYIESWADPENKAKRRYAMDVNVAFMGSLEL